MSEDQPAHLGSYLVETYWPGVTEPEMLAAVRRIRTAVHELADRACQIEYLTSYLVATDEVTFCVFRATSAELVEETCRVAELRLDRVVQMVQIVHTDSE